MIDPAALRLERPAPSARAISPGQRTVATSGFSTLRPYCSPTGRSARPGRKTIRCSDTISVIGVVCAGVVAVGEEQQVHAVRADRALVEGRVVVGDAVARASSSGAASLSGVVRRLVRRAQLQRGPGLLPVASSKQESSR